MSKATFTFGRFNPPTEAGHGKLVSAVQSHAEESGGKHYIFPSHTQDSKKNPLSHSEKAGALRKLFPDANVVSNSKVKTAIDAMKHLESKGHTHVTMIVGSDRVKGFHSLLNKYRTKEFPGIKKVEVKSAGQRDPDAEGAEGMSASKLRGLVKAGKRDEFISHYSNKELGASIHDKVKKAMSEETNSPIGIFLLGGPGSGKDYVLKNIFSRFDLTEVQLDQVLTGKASELLESKTNIVINGAADAEKIELIKTMLEGYEFDTVYVSVTNKVSRARNEERTDPLPENKRLEKWYRSEKLAEQLDCFVFNNSINLVESSQFEQIVFAGQIEKLLERLVERGLVLSEKKFPAVAKDKESGLPKKYVAGLSASTAKARAAHWKEKAKLSDSDPRAYEPAPGDATAKTKPSKYTLKVRKMMDEAEQQKVRHVPRSGNITAVMNKRKETGRVAEKVVEEGAADKSLSAKAAKSGVSLSTLKKVYRRGVAAWNSGHRPGTTPSQWGHARVNSYISKGKTYHTADKDLREDIDQMFEQEMDCCPDNYVEAVDITPTLSTSTKKKKSQITPPRARDAALDGMPVVTSGAYVREEDSINEIRAKVPNAKQKFQHFLKTPRQLPPPKEQHPVPAGYERVKSWGGAYEIRKIREKPTTVKEAVEYHVENQISFTENVFRPGSEMFFEMISEAKKLYKEGKYTPADKFELDMLNSDIGEIAEFEGQQVVLDYPIEEGLEECWTGYTQKGLKKKGDKMVPNCVPVNEIFDNTYPYKSHGKVQWYGQDNHLYSFQVPSKNPEDKKKHTFSVIIGHEQGDDGEKTGQLAFSYHGKQSSKFTPIERDGGIKFGKQNLTRKFAKGAAGVLSTVMSIAKKHAKEHNLESMTFSGDTDEPSRIKLYDRLAAKHGGRTKGVGFGFNKTYTVPVNEEDKTDGKGIGKPWREGGGGAVYVRTGDGGVKKVRFSQSGMTKKFMDPGATKSFVARHHCLTNKDKTSASYWACRYPRFFSNSGKTWW